MASRTVIIDSDELRQFAMQLKRFNSELDTSSRLLYAQFKRLGDTWRDPAYQKFAQEFDQTIRNLQRFRQISEQVVPQLLKKADRVDSVHGR